MFKSIKKLFKKESTVKVSTISYDDVLTILEKIKYDLYDESIEVKDFDSPGDTVEVIREDVMLERLNESIHDLETNYR